MRPIGPLLWGWPYEYKRITGAWIFMIVGSRQPQTLELMAEITGASKGATA